MVARLPSRLLRLEGLAVAVAALVLYFHADYGWLALVLFILAPDLSALGYLGGPSLGAASYDVVHTYVLPVTLGVVGVLVDAETATQIALVWLAHIGFDRFFGYGLKYPTGFKDTHLQRV
ncbi:MAG: hypothetical protein A2146_01905 [Actinobacteria bacterium RBG_16_67_10]|nr:MAG: hypothetical protein A2146_01905 [Actinobacteria bacterium RBG_16_67_10]